MPNTFNPYPVIGTQLTSGLDAIATAFAGGGSTVDDLVTAIYDYIQPIYYPTSGGATVPMHLQVEIKSVAYNIINAYDNKALLNTIIYDDKQMIIIRMMLGFKTTNATPINSLNTWLTNIENAMTENSLSIQQQTPLLLAIQCAKSIYAYWVTEVDDAMSNWASYFGTTSANRNYANIALWTTACAYGALIGAHATEKGLIAPTTDIISVNIVSALIGALAIGAGKVIFTWVPDIQPKELVVAGSNLSGGFSDVIEPQTTNRLLGSNEKDCKDDGQCSNKGCSDIKCKNTGNCTNECATY